MSICINYDGLRCRGAKIARIFDLFLHGYKISVADVEMYAERFDDGRVIGHFCLPPKAGTTDCVSYNTPSESCDLPIKAPTPAEFVSWMNQRKPEDVELMRKVVDAFKEYNSSRTFPLKFSLDDPEALKQLVAGRRKTGCLVPLALFFASMVVLVVSATCV